VSGTGVRDVRVRDRRRKDWYSVDNEILDDFGERISLHGFGVYCALARYSWGGTEEASVSLTTLCKKLKMGRAKLLQTLALLKDVGLIDIEPGNRTTSSVYVLLEVPKREGGSEENHRSSEENHPGSEENQGGGSEENPYKTTVSQNSSKGTEGGKEENPYSLEEYLKSRGLDDYFGSEAT
jgi:hypothetical protein